MHGPIDIRINCCYPLAKITYKYEPTTPVIKIYQFVTETKQLNE